MPRHSNKDILILEFVTDFVQEHGYSPSFREIGKAVGLRSTASISYHVRSLRDRGLLQTRGAEKRQRVVAGKVVPAEQYEELLAKYNALRENFADYVFSGTPNPAPYCENACDACVDARGWCNQGQEQCRGFSPKCEV